MSDTKICAYCGVTFQRRTREDYESWGRRKFCDRKCGARGRRIQGIYERLWSKVATGWESECWEWQGAKSSSQGHGQLGPSGASRRHHQAHRVAWEFFYGPVPDGMYVCHRCDNPPCCNPAHLFLGTHADNMRDMRDKGRGRRGDLPASTVRAVRRAAAAGDSYSQISRKCGVSSTTAWNIIHGRTYEWVS